MNQVAPGPAAGTGWPPPRHWWPTLDRATFGSDLRAGLTMGVLVVPQAVAYAALAGLPPITGLYATLIALTVYSLLGASVYTSPGPAAIDALLVAATVGPLAGGDPARYLALAGTLALLTGLIQLAAGLLRLGSGLVAYVSPPVVAGFTAAAALTIIVTQLPALLGLPSTDPLGTLRQGVESVSRELGEIAPVSAALGLACLLALLAARRWAAPWVPAPLLVLVAAAAAAVALDVRVVGDIPNGLPHPTLSVPSGADLGALLPAAAALALIGFLETYGPASTMARRTRGQLAANPELIALGACNIAVSLFRGFNVAGGFSRGALQFAAGARTPLTCLLTAGTVLVSLLALTPLIALLPTAALAAVIVVAVVRLVDMRGALEVARVRRTDLSGLVAAFVATAALGPVTGLAVGVAVSLLLFLRQSARPPFPELGRVAGTVRYRNRARYPDIRTDPTVLLCRLDAPLYFANSQAVADRIGAKVRERTDLRYVVFDASAMSWIDHTGTETLDRLAAALAENGIELHLAAMRGPPRDVLLRSRGGRRLAEQGRLHPDVHSAVQSLDLAPDSPLR